MIAGIALGAVGYALLIGPRGKESPVDTSDLYGTITSREASTTLRPGQTRAIALDQVSGSIAIKSSSRVVLADLHLKAADVLDCMIKFNRNELSFKGFTQEKEATGQVEIGYDYVRFAHAGDNKYVIGFENRAEKAVSLSLVLVGKEGSVLFETALSTERGSP